MLQVGELRLALQRDQQPHVKLVPRSVDKVHALAPGRRAALPPMRNLAADWAGPSRVLFLNMGSLSVARLNRLLMRSEGSCQFIFLRPIGLRRSGRMPSDARLMERHRFAASASVSNFGIVPLDFRVDFGTSTAKI
jgi:hypothetical protein